MKKLLVIALILALCLGCVGTWAEETEAEVFSSGDFKYILLEDGTAEITYYSGRSETLEIPEASKIRLRSCMPAKRHIPL